MSKRRLMTAAAVALAVALAAAPMSALHSQTPARQDSASRPAWGVNAGTTTMTPPARGNTASLDVRGDTASVREVVTGNLLEIQLGNLAERKASDPSVKQFAQQMVKDTRQWTSSGSHWVRETASRSPPSIRRGSRPSANWKSFPGRISTEPI